MTHYHTNCVHCGDTHFLANHNEVPTYCCLDDADSAAWDVSTYFLSEQMHEEEFSYSGWEDFLPPHKDHSAYLWSLTPC
jgi:hypothetical protein